MSEEWVIRNCSPTLAGLKTGNLFNYRYADKKSMLDALRRWNIRLRCKGIRVIPLRCSGGDTLIYMYRPSLLKRDLQNSAACGILKKCGYASDCSSCIARLMRRLEQKDDFPHEIGLFLGYPPEDVDGFIRNKAGGFKCVGFWKVYGDKECAERTFALFKKCSRVYLRRWSEGFSVDRLTVSK